MQTSEPHPFHRDVAFRYHLKNRFNPNHAHERITQLAGRCTVFVVATAACILVSLIFSLLIWYLTEDSFLQKTFRISIIVLPSILFCPLAIRLYVQIHKERKEAKALLKEIEVFEARYRNFLETVGLTPVDLNPLSDRKIEKLCEDLLGNEAKATAVKSPRAQKSRQKRLSCIYETVTHIGYGNRPLEDYLKKAKRKSKPRKNTSRRAKA